MDLTARVDGYRDLIANKLDDFLDSKGLDPMVGYDSTPLEVEHNPLTMAVYLAESQDGTASYDGSSVAISWAVVFVHSTAAMVEDIRQAEEYYSAVFDFLSEMRWGDATTIEKSSFFRMDSGEAFNGAAYLMKTIIPHVMDYDVWG